MSSPVIERIETRLWQDSDFAASVVLNREAEEHIGIGSETGDWARDMEGISDTFAGSGGEFLVGHLDEKMVVMGGFKLHTPTLAEVKRMRVSPELQGQGIGPWLLGLLETDMRDCGVTEAVVSTLSVQTSALKLYTRAGYTETGRKELTEGPETGFVVVSFAKSLA
jgi:ribosomal protein S18 acetylase RimI-like enzyme